MDEDIIVPAVNGTLSILNEALKTPSIKRIVFTSSIACVVDFHNGITYYLLFTIYYYLLLYWL